MSKVFRDKKTGRFTKRTTHDRSKAKEGKRYVRERPKIHPKVRPKAKRIGVADRAKASPVRTIRSLKEYEEIEYGEEFEEQEFALPEPQVYGRGRKRK